MPPPISRQFLRCFGVARRRRGNHSNGADTCRPSAKVTTRESSVKVASTASATGLTTKVLIPCNYKLFAMLFNHLANRRQLVTSKGPRLRQLDRLQPEFGILLRALYMNVRRLVAFP